MAANLSCLLGNVVEGTQDLGAVDWVAVVDFYAGEVEGWDFGDLDGLIISGRALVFCGEELLVDGGEVDAACEDLGVFYECD